MAPIIVANRLTHPAWACDLDPSIAHSESAGQSPHLPGALPGNELLMAVFIPLDFGGDRSGR